MKNIIVLTASLLLLGGCASKKIYYWGEYEELIYNQYSNPGKAAPEVQILAMESDIQKAQGIGLPLPPGFYAHLGYLYLQTGNVGKAKYGFASEKQKFPESAVMMDRFLKKLK